MQELIEGALFVAVDGPAFGETVPAIELEGGLERGAGAGLQREAPVTPPPSLGDDVFENRGADALSEMCVVSPHGLDFPGAWLELLQRAHAKKVFAFP